MKTLAFALAIVFAGAVAQAAAPQSASCPSQVMGLMINVPGQHRTCAAECVTEIQGTKVFQKVSGGYLLTSQSPAYTEPVFLKTKKQFPAGALITDGSAVCTGEFKYTSLDGYDQSVPAFKLTDDSAPIHYYPGYGL